MVLSKTTQKYLGLSELSSNQEIIKSVISKYPGLRFHEIKKESSLANGTLQHHLSSLEKAEIISIDYDNFTPRYFLKEIAPNSRIIIKRLNQVTPSRIIKLLLKKDCQTFSQLVKYSFPFIFFLLTDQV